MKYYPLVLAGALCLFIGSCKASTKTADAEDTAVVADSAQLADADTADQPDVIPFKTKKFEKKKGENELEVEYPVEGEPATLQAIRSWINESLGETYRGNLDDADAFWRHYVSNLGEDPDLKEYGGYTIDKFEVEYTNDNVITYECDNYVYEGGAHGMGLESGTTFLRSDGRKFTKSCITSYKALRPLFIKGLKRYFNAKTDAELSDACLGTPVAEIANPALDPWIEEDGVVFTYTPYEIAPYSAGAPKFTIPFSEIEPYLTEEGKLFIKR